jgi:hypothetical protein
MDDRKLSTLRWAVLLSILASILSACNAESPTCPVPDVATVASPAPVVQPGQQCKSVPKAQGACHRTSEDVYLAQFSSAQDAAEKDGLLFNGEVRNGREYLDYLIKHLVDGGLCAAIYEHEEIAIWSKSDNSFSENWDAIAEPGDGSIKPRTGQGAHDWTCNPATSEVGS